MNILLTGCAGFIGSHVTDLLLREGHNVVGLDDLNSAYDPRLKAWRLDQLRGRPSFRFAQADVSHQDAVDEALGAQRVDAVVHLAARAGVRQSLKDPWVYLRTNGEGTLNVLEACRRRDIPTMLLASTSSLYGGHNPRPFREDADTSRPLSPYAASKKAAEAMAASYAHLYGLNTPVVRYFTVYGPAGRPDMSVFRFIRWVAEGDPVVLYGDGTQERDFTFVEDIARGTLAALETVKGFDVVNLGNDRPARLGDMLATVERLLGRAARIDRRPPQASDVPATWADISKARSFLGWEPRVPLDKGLALTVDWYLENRAWARDIDLGPA